MSKKAKASIEAKVNESSKLSNEELDMVLNEVAQELQEQPAPKAPAKDDKPKDDKPKVDIEPLMKQLPQVVTTRDLCNLFGYTDGGKTLRRTLRSKFAEGHEHRKDWVWNKSDAILRKIVQHFANLNPQAVK